MIDEQVADLPAVFRRTVRHPAVYRANAVPVPPEGDRIDALDRRMRRIETRLVNLMRHFGLDVDGHPVE